MTEIERVMTDIRLTGMSIGKHPIRFVRAMLDHRGVVPVADLWKRRMEAWLRLPGETRQAAARNSDWDRLSFRRR